MDWEFEVWIKPLCSLKHKEITKRLEVIFESILKFKRVRERFYSWCMSDLQRRGELEGQDYKLNLERKLNSLLTISEDQPSLARVGVNASDEEHSNSIIDIKDRLHSITGCFQVWKMKRIVCVDSKREGGPGWIKRVPTYFFSCCDLLLKQNLISFSMPFQN